MEKPEALLNKLQSSSLTKDDVLAILDWQLSLPAEEIDCDLVAECDLFLSPDAPGLNPEKRDEMLASLLERIRAEEPGTSPANSRSARKSARTAHRRPLRRKALAIALIAALLLALAISGAAYGIRRGVLNFNEDWGWSHSLVSQEGADEFVISGTLAHLSLDHVDIDVLEAVTDGAELRVVYSIKSNQGLEVQIPSGSDYYDVPGAAEDGVHMCDWIEVNGQDAYFDDAYVSPGDSPGQILYYLQTNLPSWGVDISGADELHIGLPMLDRDENSRSWGKVEFTIPAHLPADRIQSAELVEANTGGYPVTLTEAIFSPLNGFVMLHLDGITREEYTFLLSTFCEVYGMDDYVLTDSHVTRIAEDETGINIGITMLPPLGEWPEQMILALEKNDYTADWEALIRLIPSSAQEE